MNGIDKFPQMLDYVMRLSRSTRLTNPDAPGFVKELLSWGAGPRASQYLVLGAKVCAALAGRNHVAIEDVRRVAHPVLRHRIVTNFSAAGDGITSDIIIDRLLEEVTPAAGVGVGLPGVA